MGSETPFLSGKMVCLRPFESDDSKGPYPNWLNDAEVCAGNSHHVYPYTVDDALVSCPMNKFKDSLDLLEDRICRRGPRPESYARARLRNGYRRSGVFGLWKRWLRSSSVSDAPKRNVAYG
jgi:hypothetical protein